MTARGFLRDERGVTALLTALVMGIILVSAAFAVDFGYVFLKTRKLQGVADIAALAAAGDIDNAQRAAEHAVAVNKWDGPVKVVVVTGNYTPDPNLDEMRRFTPNGTPRNAARVTLQTSAKLFFGAAITGEDSLAIARSGVAATAEVAAISIGSRLASVNGGIANALLSALTGGHVNLTVMDYNGLAKVDVDLLGFIGALRIRMNLTGETLAGVLSDEIDRDEVLSALADYLRDNHAKRAASAMQHIANASRGEVDLGQLIDLGVYGAQDRASPTATIMVNALDLANAVLTAGGARDVEVKLGATIPKLAGLTVWLAIGERPSDSPWITVTSGGEPVLHTAQMRLYAQAKVTLGAGLLKSAGLAELNLPIVVEVASADARLVSVSCPSRAGATATVEARPSIGHASIAAVDPADLGDFTRRLDEKPAAIAKAPLVTISGQARIDVGGKVWKTLKFTKADIDSHTPKTAETTDVAAATTASLLGQVSLKVDVAGLGLAVGPIQSGVAAALQAVAAPLDDTLNTLTGLHGLHLGEVDVWVTGVRCRQPALVL